MKLQISGAKFHYSPVKPGGFEDINFSIADGEVLSILGPNGCGKTTLLKCINSLIKLDGGEVLLNGRKISSLPRDEIARKIGYVPQLHQPAFPFTVLDVVLIGRAPYLSMLKSPRKEDIAIAEKALESTGISHLRDTVYTEISGGERQLVILPGCWHNSRRYSY